MGLEEEIDRLAQTALVPRGAPFPEFREALTRLFGPEGHFVELFFGHVAEYAPVLDEREIPEGVGLIKQIFHQLTWPENSSRRMEGIQKVLEPVVTLLENYGNTLLDTRPTAGWEIGALDNLASIFPGVTPLGKAASQLLSPAHAGLDIVKTAWEGWDIGWFPAIDRVFDYSWSTYLGLVEQAIGRVERPEIAILFANMFYRVGVLGWERLVFQKIAERIDSKGLMKRVAGMIKTDIHALKWSCLEELNAAPQPYRKLAMACRFYQDVLVDGDRTIYLLSMGLQGVDEELAGLLLEGTHILPLTPSHRRIVEDCRRMKAISERGDLTDETIGLMQGIDTLKGRSDFIAFAESFGGGAEQLKIVQQRINEGLHPTDILGRAGDGDAQIQQPHPKALRYNRTYRSIANLLPLGTKIHPDFIVVDNDIKELLGKNPDARGRPYLEVFRALSEHALEHMLGSEEYNKLLSDLVGRITAQDEFAHDMGWFKEGTRPPVMLKGAIPFSQGGYVVHDHFVGSHASRPCYIIHIELDTPRRIDISVFIKLYPSEDQEELQQEFKNYNDFAWDVKSVNMDRPIFPVGLSNEIITTREGKSYRAFMVPAFDGECAYRRLNGWNGERREMFAQKEKRAYFCEAMGILAGIHHRGAHNRRFQREDSAYFSRRAKQIFFGKLSGELHLKVAPDQERAFLEQYRVVEEYLNQLSELFGSYYKDASPRNDMITPRGVLPVDFEHNRKVFRGIDLVSKLESGWEYPTDETLLSGREEYLSPVEKENLIDRYILISAVWEILRGLSGPENQQAAEEANEAFLRVIRDGHAQINQPRLYAAHPEFSRFVSPEERERAHRDYWGPARLQRHLEYAGYCARDIRRSQDMGDEKVTQVNIRRLVYHATEALDAARRMAEAEGEYQGMYASLEKFVGQHCTLEAVRMAVSRL
jgi:hypothetical protein